MNTQTSKLKCIDGALFGLLIVNMQLALAAFFFRPFWFDVFHGVARHGASFADPQRLVRKCAAIWATFALIQLIALLKWQAQPRWLAIAAGLRFGDILIACTYFWFTRHITGFGNISLIAFSLGNLIVGLFFIRSYKMLVRR